MTIQETLYGILALCEKKFGTIYEIPKYTYAGTSTYNCVKFSLAVLDVLGVPYIPQHLLETQWSFVSVVGITGGVVATVCFAISPTCRHHEVLTLAGSAALGVVIGVAYGRYGAVSPNLVIQEILESYKDALKTGKVQYERDWLSFTIIAHSQKAPQTAASYIEGDCFVFKRVHELPRRQIQLTHGRRFFVDDFFEWPY